MVLVPFAVNAAAAVDVFVPFVVSVADAVAPPVAVAPGWRFVVLAADVAYPAAAVVSDDPSLVARTALSAVAGTSDRP